MVIPINVKTKNTAGSSFSLCEFFHNKNEHPAVFLVFILIGITISHDLFFQSMRQLKLYKTIITDLKISKIFRVKNSKYLKNDIILKMSKLIKFLIIKMQKGRHIRKAQSMSNPIKKRSPKMLMKWWSFEQNKIGLIFQIGQKSIFLRFMQIFTSTTEIFC